LRNAARFGQPLDAAWNRYVLKFDNDKLPPANAFWSVTMYDGRRQLLVDNPLKEVPWAM
jgi:hypothetical protein